MLDVGFGKIGGRVGDAVPIFNRECGKIAGVTGATWTMEVAGVEGLKSGAVERVGGKRGERGYPCFSNGGTHTCRGPVCFKLEHLVGCPCSVWIGISTLVCFFPKRDAGRFEVKEWTSGERGNKGNVVTNSLPM
jgi:hypothetical protein